MERVIGQGRQRASTWLGAGATRAAALALALAIADTASAGTGVGRDREHAAWTSLLGRHVSDGLIGDVELKRASRSCSLLRDEAYLGGDLDAQLGDAARSFRRGGMSIEFLEYDWSLDER